MKVFLALDDWNSEAIEAPASEALEICMLNFPNFKVNLFVSMGKTIPENEHPDKYAYLLHGFSHKYYDELTDEQLEEWKYDRIYRPPYWLLRDDMYERLIRHGYRVANALDDPRGGLKYTWDIRDSPDLTKEILIGHGHITQAPNNIADCLPNILKLPKDTGFGFLRDWEGEWR